MSIMDSLTGIENAAPGEGMSSREHFLPPPMAHQDTLVHPPRNSQLRGSGSYPSMIRTRTANRSKITKRTSDSMIIAGHHHYHHHHPGHHVSSGSTSSGGGMMTVAGAVISEGNTRSASSKKRKLLNNKRTVFSKASRRKSLENLGLLVRNRCGTAKLQWPSEKKETDVFDLLPEGCIQVRQLIRLKSRGGGTDGSGDHCHGGSNSDFYNVGGSDRNKARPGKRDQEGLEPEDDGYCDDEIEENNDASGGKGSLTCEAKLKHQGRRSDPSHAVSSGKTDWKNKKNISVIVRIRPKQDREVVEKSIVFRTDSKTIVFDPKEKTKDFYFQGVKQLTRNDFGRKRPNRNVSFQYDKVYGPEATNKEIFEEMLRDLTDHLIEGYNSTVFAYGATGSGKTYTMIGSNSKNPGLTVLMVESLYKRIEDLAEDYDCEVVCSYLEVYNETIKDLLRPEKELSIREDGKKGIIISELSFYKPRGPQELLQLLRSGNRARTQHATDLNTESSRSHAVFEVKLCLKRKRNAKCQHKGRSRSCAGGDDGGGGGIKYEEQAEDIKNDDDEDGGGCRRNGCSSAGGDARDDEFDDEDDGGDDEHGGINKVEVIQSKLVMVDLAGSERGTAASSSNHGGVFSDGARQREGASINKSLLALASCISALADGKCHVPYRNSKLTRLLKDSLNGLCTTVMIANISPSTICSEDTYNTLKYADRAKSIVGPVAKQKNVFMEDLIVEDCTKTQMAELQVKNVQLQEQLEEEKLKRELILKELQELQRKNVEMKSEAGQEERNAALVVGSSKMKGKASRRKSMMGAAGGDGARQQRLSEVDYGVEAEDGAEEECCSTTGKNAGASEDQLPSGVQEYIEIARERARIFSEYVEFASQTRFTEWAISCKKLKADMADFLGRLPVEDENYIWFSKLKNEVNNNSGTFCNSHTGAAAASTLADAANESDHHHKKYAVKLKNLTEKLELVRQNCVESNLLPVGGEVPGSQKLVTITLEQFLEFKRISCEHAANGQLDQFYQQFCQQINNQLMTSGMTLMNALKTVKSVYLQLRQVEESTTVPVGAGGKRAIYSSPGLQHEYRELLDLVYGPGPPLPPQTQEDKGMATENSNNISSNVNNDSLLPPLSVTPPPPQNLPQLSNLGRKSSPIMDDLANMRKLVERPLLVQFTSLLGTSEEETEIKVGDEMGFEEHEEGEDEGLEFSMERAKEEQLLFRTTNSTFSRFVTTAATTRKSLSTSHTIYETPKPPPGTRIRGGESSPELQLPSHRRATCIEEQGEEEEDEDDDEDETRYNADNVEDNDHHYLHPPRVIDNDDDDFPSFPPNGPFQAETSVVTANESFSKEVWNSLPSATTNNISGVSCNLVNPVKRKNSTSFEIIFDKKEDKRVGGRGGHGKTTKLNRNAGRVNEKASTPFGPSVMSALSKQKIRENHFNNGHVGLNEDWTTTASSSSGTVTASSASTSSENVMLMRVNNKSGGVDTVEGGSGSAQQKKSIGNKKRLADQALIKDYRQPHHHLHQQTKGEKTGAVVVVEESNNKNCREDGHGEMERGDPSCYIYQLDSLLSPSSVDVLEGTGGIESNKRGFENADDSSIPTTRKVKGDSSTKSNKADLEKEFAASATSVGGVVGANNNKTKTRTFQHTQNPNLNPLRRRGHLKQQEGENGVLPMAVVAGTKADIGSSWRSNNNLRQQQQCSNASGRKNTVGGGEKSLNPVTSVAAGAGAITSTTPPEFAMNAQGQRKSQPQQTQRLLQYKVSLPVKKSIALHPSKASTDLTAARSSEKVDTYPYHHHQRQQKVGQHYHPSQQDQHKEQDGEMLVVAGSGKEESEWEVRSAINMPNTNQKSKQWLSQHSVLSSARSTMSHQKAPYFTNCKTFTISRESLPTANMPVISSLPGHSHNQCGSGRRTRRLSQDELTETMYGRQKQSQQQKGEIEANYYDSNDEEDVECCGRDVQGEEYEDINGNYTSAEDNDNGDATSCYSDDCN